MKNEYMPQYLSVYVVTKVLPQDVCNGVSGEDWNSFKLACPCGCNRLEVLGVKNVEYDCFVDPFYTRCPDCGKRDLLFDSRKHGYDAQIEFSYPDPVGEEETWDCPKCHSPGIVAMTYEYSLNPEEEDLGDLKLEECFSWVVINHICTTHGRIHEIASIETM